MLFKTKYKTWTGNILNYAEPENLPVLENEKNSLVIYVWATVLQIRKHPEYFLIRSMTNTIDISNSNIMGCKKVNSLIIFSNIRVSLLLWPKVHLS